MAMPVVPERVVSAIARAGSLLALALGLWYACAAAGIPFAAFIALFIIVAAGVVFGPGWLASKNPAPTPRDRDETPALPLVPLLVWLAVSYAAQLALDTWYAVRGGE